ncbi:restriction endonuclease subunit S [Marinococcus halophilus]|uniref:restriction endonuclease subunit S n=1 Tax=Marinococcus halophilus TaxID=1371 RepID=UPI00360FCA31
MGEEPKGNKLDYPCVRVADFDRDNLSVQNKELTIRNIEMSNIESVLLVHGDLLIEKSGGGEKQPVGFVVQYTKNHPAVYANFIAKLSINDKIAVSGYLKYLHATLYNQGLTKRSIKQTTGIQNLDLQSYLNEIVVYPNISEQSIIANYLDQKTSEIDKLIADKEKLIELLKEKRQAIITETVTKGLNPNVKMKDSGMEWLGEIPEHWKTSKVKYTTYVKGRIGWQGLRFEEFVDEGPYLITGMHFKNDSVNWEACYHISQERYEEAPEIQIKEGDLLLTKDGTIGKLAYINYLPGKASLNSHLLVMRPSKNLYKNKFMYWYMKSISFINFININQSGTTFAGISQQSIENLSFPLPGLEEQEKIVNHLDNEISMVNKSIEMVSEQINKLKEYRQSLIYEAVTGKIDVQEMMNEAGQEEVPSS